ncbi:hypothetical protein [Flavobacterium foetidum]|uniref:hypothetical protein n=1 Tax=Flavobacterium foetidum TaxID=2026681 RepID=UPI0010756413|nr:hypothetical protein [Flavobacterium foetidum]KAF2515704.1 hypothetical protein E0W73_08935 [Flavobacterium foetidum]
METNKDKNENQQDDTNQNANSAYSGSGSMQPGGGQGEAGRLNDYPEEEATDETKNPEGKSIEEATDPSKLDKL